MGMNASGLILQVTGGPSDPLSVPKCHVEMRRRGHTQKLVEKISLENPLSFLRQSGRFMLPESV